MATQGSNELNALLKARVVKIRIELDYKNSKLPTQINTISKWLKDTDKAIKIGVKLDLPVKDFNKQINSLFTTLKNSKTANTAMKLKVDIDVAGSAKNIKKQLQDVYKTVQDFNRDYGQQIKHMQQVINNANGKGNTSKKANSMFGAVDPSLYVQSLKDAEKYMRSFIGNKKGLFSSTELKDANGNLNGFIATLTNANGVVNKIHYQWNEKAKTFAPINRTTVTETQKSVAKAKEALMSLYADIQKLKDGSSKTSLLSQFDDLEKRAGHMTLNMNNVNQLKRQIKEEGVLQQQVKATNDQYMKQEELIRKITASMNRFWSKADKTNANSIDVRNQYKNLLLDVKTNPSADYKAQELELRRINDLLETQSIKEREIARNTKLRISYLRQLESIERKTISTDVTSNSLIAEIKLLSQRAKTGKDWLVIAEKMNRLKVSNANDKDLQKALDLQYKIRLQLEKLRDLGKLTNQQLTNALVTLTSATNRGTADLDRMLTTVSRKVRTVQDDMKRVANQSKEILSGGSSGANHIKSVVNAGDINALQRYFGELYKGKVQTVTMKETTDQLGRAVTEMKVKMAGTGKEVQTYTVQMERANGALRQTASGLEYNANRNLGVFEQLRIAMERVPVWMVAMTAFYGTINTVKKMTREVLELDKALTEIRRVASSNISVDALFGDAVALSKELGNNVHDVLAGVGDMARTFGEFNERQLIAITRTATLMSNVSDLTAQEATNSLIGTMNAFNITAEESIHIVDALNEVDNNYAISTKQLAEGLSKSASTASTFGASLEDVVGHITAIGAVTMESGSIIGNSLKTIYSRITTIDDAREAIQGVGVAMEDQTGQLKSAQEILSDVAGNWNRMSDEQRQNLAVTVAGRYQLSRFLALMNNWEMAQSATNTAIYSQGSALRENAQYMKSFEARINQLKNGFTELSSAVGGSILSDGLMTIIGLLKNLAEAGVWVAKNFGALPAVFLALVPVLAKMGILDSIFKSFMNFRRLGGVIGIFQTATSTMSRFYSVQRDSMRNSLGPAQITRVQALANGWRAVTVAEAGATAGMRGFALAMKSALISTGIGALIVGLGFVIEKITSKIAENKRKAEELRQTNEKMVTSYRQHRDGMEGMIERYDELSKKQIKSKSEEEELLKIHNDFATQLPTTVAYIDANGKAHLKSVDAIKREVEQVKQLSKEQAKLKNEQFEKTLEKQAKNYQKIADKIKDLNEQRKKLEKDDGGTYLEVDYSKGANGQYVEKTRDNSEAIQKNKVEVLMAEAEKTEVLKKTIKAIQAQSLAWLEANNMMANLTDDQQSAVETFIAQNEAILRNAENFEDAYVGLYQWGNQIGKAFSDATDTYKKMLQDTPDLAKTMNLEEFKTQMNLVAKSIPDTFYSMTDASGNLVKSQDDVINGLKEIVNVSAIAKTAHADQADSLIYRLERTGMTAEEAQNYLWRLADANKNLELRTEASKNMTGEQVEALQDLNEEALKAIDITNELFGYSSDSLGGIKSRLQAMHIMVDTMGVQAKSTEDYKGLLMDVSDLLGVTTDDVEKNATKYFRVADALSKIDWSAYTPEMDLKTFLDKQKDLSPDTKKLFLGWKGAKDIITGKVKETAQEVANEAPKVSKPIEDIFKDLQFELPEIDLTRTKASIFYVEDDIKKLEKKLKDLGVVINTPTGNAMIDGMMGHLQMADGKVLDTQDNMLLLRGMLTAGISTGFFDSIINSADGTKTKVDNTNEAISILKQNTQAPFSPDFNPLYQGLDTAKQKAGEVGDAWSINQSLFSNPVQVNTQPFQTVDQMVNNFKNNSVDAKKEVDKAVSAGSEVGKISGDIKIVVEQAKGAKDDIENLNKSLGGLGDGFSTGAVRDEIGRIGDESNKVRGKVDKLIGALLNVNSVQATGIQELSHQLALLCANLALVTQYGGSTASAQKGIINAFERVAESAKSYNQAISHAGENAGKYFGIMADAIDGAVNKIYRAYMKNIKGLEDMVDATNKSLNKMLNDYNVTSKLAVDKIESMTSKMHKAFKDGVRDIVSTAGTLPKQIGDAVRSNMKDASNSMDALAKDMVRRFKSELGIHSPSRVFEDLGGWVVKGLVNGLTGHDLKSLGKNVFDDFGGGIFDSWDMIKAYVSGDFTSMTGSAGAGVQQWAGVASKALMMTGQYSEANLQRLLYQMQTESSGNARAINLWDSNAKRGTPSKGLMQVIDPTFRAYAMKGYDTNIYDPLSNILASIRYAMARYGSLARAYRGVGYANGGFVDKMELAWHGEEGAEAIIPLIQKRRKRGLDLWMQTGERLGIDPEAIAFLKQLMPKSGGMSFGGAGSFGATSGEGGAVGGGDSGASGTITPSVPTIIGTNTYDGGYEMMALATKKTPKKTTSKTTKTSKPKETLSDLYKSNEFQKAQEALATSISLLQTSMEAMDKTSVKYRDSLLKLNALENKRIASLNSEKKSLESRNKTIDKDLKKLPAPSKQNAKEREKYNSLKQERDNNTQRINQIKVEVASTTEEIRKKAIEVFTNLIDEIVEKYDQALNDAKRKVDTADFELSVIQLTDPDNQTKVLNAQQKKAEALQGQQATAYNKQNETKKQYDNAVKKYGKNSDQAKKAKEAYDQSVKEYQDATLAVLQAEKEIKDTRAKIAEDGINALKNYYKNMQQMATDAIEKEKAQLQKAHEAKLKMYDDEVNAINAIYDAKFKQMDKEQSEEDYNAQLAEKNARKAELVNKIALLSKDTSLEGRKKLAELQQQLTDANKDIEDFQKNRQRELERTALQEQQQAQINAINGYTDENGVYHDGLRDKENKSFDDSIEKLDAEKEAINKKYDDLINNEKHWEEIRNDAIKGSFTLLNKELTSMSDSINKMSQGIFDGLTKSFSGFSDEVKKQVAEANKLTVDNMKIENKEPVNNVKEASDAKKYTMTDGTVQKGKATTVTTPKQTTPAPKPSTSTKKPATSTDKKPATSSGTEYYTIKKGDTFSSIEKAHKLPSGSLQKLNPNVDPRKLQIGQKIVLRKGTTSSGGSKTSGANRKITTAVNFRSKPDYGNNVISTIPKDAKVEYIGMESGWAKIKYNGKTGYVGSQYLKKFDTGGYTGDNVPKSGALAILHRKELVLNERQTKNILDSAKIMDKIKDFIPKVSKASILDKIATASSVVTNITYGDINVTVQGGDKKKASDIAKELMNEIKKKGK